MGLLDSSKGLEPSAVGKRDVSGIIDWERPGLAYVERNITNRDDSPFSDGRSSIIIAPQVWNCNDGCFSSEWFEHLQSAGDLSPLSTMCEPHKISVYSKDGDFA